MFWLINIVVVVVCFKGFLKNFSSTMSTEVCGLFKGELSGVAMGCARRAVTRAHRSGRGEGNEPCVGKRGVFCTRARSNFDAPLAVTGPLIGEKTCHLRLRWRNGGSLADARSYIPPHRRSAVSATDAAARASLQAAKRANGMAHRSLYTYSPAAAVHRRHAWRGRAGTHHAIT